MDWKIRFYAACALLASGCVSTEIERAPNSAPAKAIAFLTREVPAWHRENHCFSCHNNGDGARALHLAKNRGYKVPSAAVAETSRWLSRPADWKNNKGDPSYADPHLANIQFAAALTASGGDARALLEAA